MPVYFCKTLSRSKDLEGSLMSSGYNGVKGCICEGYTLENYYTKQQIFNGSWINPVSFKSEGNESFTSVVHVPEKWATAVYDRISKDFFKPCTHTKTSFAVFASPSFSLMINEKPRSQYAGWTVLSPHTMHGTGFPTNVLITNYTQARLHHPYVSYIPRRPDENLLADLFDSLALDSNLIGLEEVQLGNFMAELTQIKSLAQLFSWHAPVSASNPFSNFAKNVGSKHLGYNFGVVPVISDLSKMLDLFNHFDRAVDGWNAAASAAKVRDFHTSKVLENTVLVDELVQGDRDSDALAGYVTCDVQRFTIVRAHLYIRPLPVSVKTRAALSKAMWGLDKPLSFLWEAMPFSWVIDYFTNIGDLVSQIERQSLLNFEVIDAGYSYSHKNFVTSNQIIKTPNSSVKSGGHFYIDETFERVHWNSPIRKATIDSFSFQLNAGVKQGTYLVALAAGGLK